MKGRVLFFFILAFVCPSVMAQHDDAFDAYCAEGMHQYGIAVKRLADFEVIDDHAIFMPSKKDSTGMWFEFVLESEDKDCLLLYPSYIHRPEERDELPSYIAQEEMAIAVNQMFGDNPAALNSVCYMKIVMDKDMGNYANADTAFIYRMPLSAAYISDGIPLEQYEVCIGLNLKKAVFPSMLAKILLTEEGKKKEKEYVEAFLSCICYGNKLKM